MSHNTWVYYPKNRPAVIGEYTAIIFDYDEQGIFAFGDPVTLQWDGANFVNADNDVVVLGEQKTLKWQPNVPIDSDHPYITIKYIGTKRGFNPNYEQSAICECGHTYDRHFDSYEDMEAIGCKYCPCVYFVPETS